MVAVSLRVLIAVSLRVLIAVSLRVLIASYRFLLVSRVILLTILPAARRLCYSSSMGARGRQVIRGGHAIVRSHVITRGRSVPTEYHLVPMGYHVILVPSAIVVPSNSCPLSRASYIKQPPRPHSQNPIHLSYQLPL